MARGVFVYGTGLSGVVAVAGVVVGSGVWEGLSVVVEVKVAEFGVTSGCPQLTIEASKRRINKNTKKTRMECFIL